jgi:hypothetical protein
VINFHQKIILKIFSISILLITSSCFYLTQKLWHIEDYKDEFRSFYFSNDHKKVIFISERFHYIFNDFNENLKKILSLKADLLFIDTENSGIYINANNNIKAYIEFDIFNQKLNPELINYLQEIGFTQSADGMSAKITIYGKRYHAPPNFYANLVNLDQIYEIKIHAKLNKSEDVIATLLSPLTITADGTIFLGGIIFRCFDD